MRVLLIEPSGAGGIGHYTHSLVLGLAGAGVECHLLTSNRFPEIALPDTVKVYRVFRGMKTNPLALWWRLFRLKNQYDLIHWQYTTHPDHVLTLMKYMPFRSCPNIQTIHNVLPHEKPEESIPVYEKIYCRMAGLIFHTHYSITEYERVFSHIANRKTLVPLGELGQVIPQQGLSPQPGSDSTILFFGNIRPYKGLDVLLQAMPLVLAQCPRARLIIAGQALQPWEPYADIINLLRIGDAVHTRIEYIPDEEIPALFSAASIVAMPYHSIDQSGVLLLAMALGKAIVATCVGGIPEVIRHEKTGLLVPPDDPPALASSLLRLLNNPLEASGFGLSAKRECEERYNWKTLAAQTKEFYQSVLDA